jgi:N-acyl homoserine lactone hydrolase
MNKALHAFHGGGEITTMALFDPWHPEVGTKVEIPYFFYLIEHPAGNVLFDTGGHPDLIRDPRPRLGAAADAFEVVMHEGDDVVSQLAAIGVGPADVDHVVLSHLHYDHAGGIELLSNSTFHLQAQELELARRPPVYQRDLYVSQDFEHDVKWNLIDGRYDLFGDGSIVMFPTPGHTRGHQSLLVGLPEASLILVGDAAPSPRNIDEQILPGLVADPDAMVESWSTIRELRDRHQAVVLCTHDLGWPHSTRVAPTAVYR